VLLLVAHLRVAWDVSVGYLQDTVEPMDVRAELAALGVPALVNYPYEWWNARQLRRWHLPAWNPYVGTGAPTRIAFQGSALNPMRLPFYVSPSVRMHDFSLLLQMADGWLSLNLSLSRRGSASPSRPVSCAGPRRIGLRHSQDAPRLRRQPSAHPPVYLFNAADTVEMIHQESLVPVSRAAARLVAWTRGQTAAGMRAAVER
jgi:hypothetical protein